MEILHGKKKTSLLSQFHASLFCSHCPQGQSLQASPVLTGSQSLNLEQEGVSKFPSPLFPAPFPFLFDIPATRSLSVPAPRTGSLTACQALLSPCDFCPQRGSQS